MGLTLGDTRDEALIHAISMFLGEHFKCDFVRESPETLGLVEELNRPLRVALRVLARVHEEECRSYARAVNEEMGRK